MKKYQINYRRPTRDRYHRILDPEERQVFTLGSKQKQRDDIIKHTQEFEARGGKITEIESNYENRPADPKIRVGGDR